MFPNPPKALFASKLVSDNNSYVEIHPKFFSVKDQDTGRTLLHGASNNGLYPINGVTSSPNKHALSTRSPSAQWHARLGHPSSSIVQQILSSNKISVSDKHDESVCDACQKGKSHQLPYPKSTSVSSALLELIFSDVWGPAPVSFGRYKYYVSFIDDFSKFTWIYLLKNKSDVFQKFRDFQQHVERLFDRKILAFQSDWGGEYHKLNSFLNCVGIAHHVSCPHAHQQNGSAEPKHHHIFEVGL
jgi:histone deacetylase 1/2